MRILSLLVSLILLFGQALPVGAANFVSPISANSAMPDAMHAADILGIRNEVEALTSGRVANTPEETELRALVVRKVLLGSLEVRRACNKTDLELAYTYALMNKHQARQALVNNTFTLLNFYQFSIFYTLEGRSRQLEQFKQSGVLGCVSAGVGTALPMMDIFYNKVSKARDVAPPNFFRHVLNGGPVDGKDLPILVARYMDTPRPGTTLTPRQEMYQKWRTAYGVNPDDPTTLISLVDGRAQSTFALDKRIVLLWSLHTYVQNFDHDLLALLRTVIAEPTKLADLDQAAFDLQRLNQGDPSNPARLQAETQFLGKILAAGLIINSAADRIDEERNYAYDIALSRLLAKRGAGLQKNFEASFMQAGVFGAVAGMCYLHAKPKAGNMLHLISSSIGTGLSTLALVQAHGGKVPRETRPNSIAQFLHLGPSQRFAPLLEDYLDGKDPESAAGRSRRDELIYLWHHGKIASINMSSPANREKVAGMPNVKFDNINILRNRIAILNSIETRIQLMQRHLTALMVDTAHGATSMMAAADGRIVPGLNPDAQSAANLLGMSGYVGSSDLQSKLAVTRAVLTAGLEVRSTVANADLDIRKEEQMLARMTRARDMAVAMTNNLNFYQINVLGIIIDGPYGITASPRKGDINDKMTIMSGLIAGGLATAAFLEQRGGWRPHKAEPNMLGPFLGVENSSNKSYYPVVLKFLDTDSVPGTSRRQELINFWKSAKLLDVNVNSEAAKEKIAATGPHHHQWNESIKLIRNRITMLYDMRAVLDLMDVGLSDLVRATDA